MEFLLPPIVYNAQGEVRKAGFEVEFGEVDLDTIAASVLELFGGSVIKHNKFYLEVAGTKYGSFSLKIDMRLLSEKSYEKIWKKLGLAPQEIFFGNRTLDTSIENALESIASVVIPFEISTPPIPIDSLAVVEQLRVALYQNKAKGTSSSVLYAYATHINPELPKCDTATALAYTRAFLLLYPWISEKVAVNFTRKLTTFINPFPEEYITLVLQPSYLPDLECFINDYYRHNPDRNRPLDLYPVLAFMNKAKVERLKNIGKVNARPTLHYRIPNSLIDDPSWSLAKEWNTWVAVEKLASDPESIRSLSQEYLSTEKKTTIGFKSKWISRINNWMNALQ